MVHAPKVVDDVPAAFVTLLEEQRPRSVALSGGSTAHNCYEACAVAQADWSDTTFWFGDERWVSVDDPDSNEGMARRVWLDRVPVGGIVSMVNAGSDPESAAASYGARLQAAGGIDVVHLGLGPDGHTASLFPGSPSTAETARWVIATGDEAHPHPRLTLTFVALAAARQIVVTAVGAEKRQAVAGVLAGNPDLPAGRLVVDPLLAAKTVWLLDADAARS